VKLERTNLLDAPRLLFATFLVDVVGAFFNDREARTIRAFSRGLTPWGYVTLRILLLAPLACCSAASAAVAVCREASPDTGRASLSTVSYARSSRLSAGTPPASLRHRRRASAGLAGLRRAGGDRLGGL
jgi:hypothetical protein